MFAAGARHRGELAAIDGGGAAKLAEAADRYELSRFVLCSVIGADRPERRSGGVRDFLAAKQHAEHVLARLELPWTSVRFGAAHRGAGRRPRRDRDRHRASLTLSRDDAALVVADTLTRGHLAHQAVHVIDGDRAVASALDAIPPLPLPAGPPPAGHAVSLGAAQSDNPPDDPDMIAPDGPPLDADVDWEGDGPVPPEPVDNDDPAPGIP